MWPLATSACIRSENRSSIPYSRCRYGPAQKQPLRAWIPNRSLSTATTNSRAAGAHDDAAPATRSAGAPLRYCRGSRCSGSRPRPQRTPGQVVLAAADLLGADLSLSANTNPARIDSTIAGVPPSSRTTDRVICVAVRADEQDRSAARHRRHAVAKQRALDDEHAGRARAADELVRRQEDRVLAGHVDRQVRTRRRIVPARERAVRRSTPRPGRRR